MFYQPERQETAELERQEFYTGLNELGVTLSKKETDALFTALDTNGNFKISFEEFLNGISKPLSQARSEIINKAFTKYDINKSGFLLA